MEDLVNCLRVFKDSTPVQSTWVFPTFQRHERLKHHFVLDGVVIFVVYKHRLIEWSLLLTGIQVKGTTFSP